MKLETKNKIINLVFKTRKIVEIANTLKNKDFEDVFTKAYSICDLDALSKIVYTLAEDEEGKHAFETSEAVYDFLDDYRTENKCNLVEVYKKIAEALNEEGFFKKKKTKKEIEEMTLNPLSGINMNEVVQRSATKAMEAIAVEEVKKQSEDNTFKGYKA